MYSCHDLGISHLPLSDCEICSESTESTVRRLVKTLRTAIHRLSERYHPRSLSEVLNLKVVILLQILRLFKLLDCIFFHLSNSQTWILPHQYSQQNTYMKHMHNLDISNPCGRPEETKTQIMSSKTFLNHKRSPFITLILIIVLLVYSSWPLLMYQSLMHMR